MQLIDYGSCQVVHLINVFRPQGHVYFPEIAAKIISRYKFVKPPTLDDFQKEPINFQVGEFAETQIAEFGLYHDGIVVSGRCPTEVLEDFLSDVLEFSAKELAYIPILEHRNELHFESNLVVQSDADLGAFIIPTTESLIRKVIEEKVGVRLQSSGIVMDCDPGTLKMRRKPSRVFIERRIGLNFEDNIFLCVAPLRTKDHIELLSTLEREALSKAGH